MNSKTTSFTKNQLSLEENKLHTFFDYVCLMVLSGTSETIQFADNIWDTFSDIEAILNKRQRKIRIINTEVSAEEEGVNEEGSIIKSCKSRNFSSSMLSPRTKRAKPGSNGVVVRVGGNLEKGMPVSTTAYTGMTTH